MPTRITKVTTHDLRFPTSKSLDGSDAMNPDPDYSAAYAILHTDRADGLAGHGMTFTIGRGNQVDRQFSVNVGAVRYTERFSLGDACSPAVLQQALDAIAEDLVSLDRVAAPDALVGMGGAVTNIAAVMLSGHCCNTGVSPRRSLRSVNQCDTPAPTIPTTPNRIRRTPNWIARWCNRCVASLWLS